ncbi:hypothetical protein PR202_ga12444 [Eleusine coracana subsp. coracana]|uniref:Uncharacterized protein n=1 Tax=Eleusine coracana subsp. coracana TaxID=191504 RepID=A0AAV5CC33_ELECO|nr:hypothetical protein PR202_ga12444 [Eleusine coracana subsp. coracana]
MAQQRAKWSSRYEKGLVDRLTEYRFSHYRGQFAEQKHCFTSSKPQKSRGIGIEGETTDKVTLDFTQKRPWSLVIEVGACHGDGSDSPTRYDELRRQGLGTKSVQEKEYPTSQLMDGFGQQLLEKEHPQYGGRQNKISRQRIASGGKGPNVEHTQEQQYEPDFVSDKDEIDELQQSDEQATSRSVAAGPNRGRPKKSDVAKPVTRIEETMSEFLALKKEQSIVKMRSKMTKDIYSMTRWLAVLQDIDDVSDKIKIHASDVFKDALNREIFLGYEPRLRALWLKKEVNKLGIDMTTY